MRITAPLVRSVVQSVQRRSLSASLGRRTQWGFIGLGQMGMYLAHATTLNYFNSDKGLGYNMARNLQAKLPSSDTLRVFDINAESIQKFTNETKALGSGAVVKIAANAREAAEDSVRLQ